MPPAPPPDFRYVGIEPGPSPGRARGLQLGCAAVAFVVGLLLAGEVTVFSLLASAAAAGLALTMVRRGVGPVSPAAALGSPRLSIVPWGVLVHAEPSPRILRWAAIRSVSIDGVHEMDHATPSTRWSLVTLRTERETLGGRAPGSVGLERLEAHFERYALEASRPLALDLEGEVPMDDTLEPGFERLLGEARRLVASGDLTERLALEPRSYRDPGSVAGEDSRRVLRGVLASGLASVADARALAAVLAAELGARELLPVISTLTLSPNPALAAVARGAALRLGADLVKTGAFEELADFVNPLDLASIRAWASQVGGSSTCLRPARAS